MGQCSHWFPPFPIVSIGPRYPACVWLCAAMCCEILLVLLNYVGCSRKWPVNCPSAVGAAAAGLCCFSGDLSADSTPARISTGLFPYRTTAASDTCEELSVVLLWLSNCRTSETKPRIGLVLKSSQTPGLYTSSYFWTELCDHREHKFTASLIINNSQKSTNKIPAASWQNQF